VVCWVAGRNNRKWATLLQGGGLVMPDGSLQNSLYDAPADQDRKKRKRPKSYAIGLKITASILLLIGAVGIGAFVVGLQQGWLREAWNGLTEAQGAVLGATLTIYAAALAAVVGPLIFTGQITSMREASDETLQEMGSHIEQLAEKLEYVRKVMRQADEIQDDRELNDEKALLTLEGIRQDAAATAVEALERSRRKKVTKAKFSGKWPGRRPYTELLKYYNVITEQEATFFNRIDATRQYTRETVTPEILSEAQNTLQLLRTSLAARRAKIPQVEPVG
jgi:hypothetical protein